MINNFFFRNEQKKKQFLCLQQMVSNNRQMKVMVHSGVAQKKYCYSFYTLNKARPLTRNNNKKIRRKKKWTLMGRNYVDGKLKYPHSENE